MRCKKHLPDLTSTIGVCASCLRERLLPLVAAQAQAQPPRFPGSDADRHRHKKPQPNPPPLNFPRSVSPYVSRRKSDCDRRREKLFYHTPQVDAAACGGGTASSKRKLGGRFWIISNLFRARSNKMETSSRESCEEPTSSVSPPSTTSWFSTILPARRHNHGANDRRRCRQMDRGLSPAVTENFTDELDGRDRSASGCSSESSPGKQNQTAAETAARRSRLGPAGKGLTSMAFCLSPLVRASPNRHWSHKGLAQEIGVGGPHHISTAASFCPNRSRKLADFGRLSHNR
ncbi:uncharacterized protein LOC113850615 [Abrus precatorius]|uniref:Uncharacterized protein LOC113850615 n=1 Tax=Abrus precatorius TaxID=3816 RepID=A0A8B8K035_ABRPR|nr:uncharacterized protein LOC113850615 [Abrus precatorius]